MLRSLLAAAALLLFPVAALAQDEPVQAVQSPPAVAPDALSQAQAAQQRGDAAEALSRYLRVLSSRPDDPAALAGAGRAALDVGDVNAAAGFFARAEARDPRNGQVKAGLARVLLQRGDARGALRYFREATGLGVPVAAIAADRGLAYDLRGDARRAQADYASGLAAGEDAETRRRLALSQAIGGDRATAMATLDPLLRRQDVPAWRTRALVFALTGDPADALTGAALVMRRDQVDALAPYLPRLAALKPVDKAAAVHLGRFPSDSAAATRVAAATPVTPPVVTPSVVTPSVVVAAAAPSEDIKARDQALVSALAAARKRVGSSAEVRSRADRIALADAEETRTAAPPPAPTVLRATMPPPAPASQTPSVALEAAPSQVAVVTAPALPPVPGALSSWTLPSTSPVTGATPVPTQVASASLPPQPSAPPTAPATRAPVPMAKPTPTRAEKLAEEKARKTEAAAKKKAEEQRLAEAEARKVKSREPARHWVQVAGGANKRDLGRAWDDLKKKWPRQLAGRSPWTMHYRFTNRLLIGPFPSSDAAQDWVGERKKEGLASFRVETNAGDPVERVTS